MVDKADQSTGNKFLFIVNDRGFMLVNQVLGHYLADFKTDGTFMYSKQANGYVNVGATFQSYEFMGKYRLPHILQNNILKNLFNCWKV